MRVPKITRKRKMNLASATKVVIVAESKEIETLNKEISLTMQKLARKGYCKNGYVIVNGVAPKKSEEKKQKEEMKKTSPKIPKVKGITINLTN